MSPSDARLLFDECIPKPSVERLKEFVRPAGDKGPRIYHLLDFENAGTLDEEWMPRFRDGDWTVVSADGGRKPKRNRGKKLPKLCEELGVTLILLSPAVHERKAFDKARTIISVWNCVLEIATEADRGKRFMIEPLVQDNYGIGKVTERSRRLPVAGED